MKRLHVHLHVGNLSANIDFYSKMFGSQFGVDHLGIRTDNAEDLAR